jgi:uncharacterized protein (DUF983 family)
MQHCPRCHAGRLVEIALNVAERKVRMRSCSRCDTRWWDADGEGTPLPAVLELAAARR